MRTSTKKHLNEQDFRMIRESIKVKRGKTYTTEYLRKVYKGVRKNYLILNEIDNFQELWKEFEWKLMEGKGKLYLH